MWQRLPRCELCYQLPPDEARQLVTCKKLVFGKQGQVFVASLRDEQPVERVVVNFRQGPFHSKCRKNSSGIGSKKESSTFT